jgi:hypothetical protein
MHEKIFDPLSLTMTNVCYAKIYLWNSLLALDLNAKLHRA